MISLLRRGVILTCCVCCMCCAAAAAPVPEARQFDFLVGQWKVSGEAKASGVLALIHGAPKLVGSWKAWRVADDRGIEDELTLTDASGNPVSTVHFTRTFSPRDNSWTIATRNTHNGSAPRATARWTGDEMLVMGGGTGPDGKRYRSRTHYAAITPLSFRMVQDRSYDDGKTWERAAVTLDVRRTGG